MITKSKSELARLRCHIVGLAPGFLQHSCRSMKAEGGIGAKITPEEMAEKAAYYVDDNARTKQLALPWRCLYNAMVTAAGNYKLSGNITFRDTIAGSIACEQDNIPLVHVNGKPIRKYTIKRDAHTSLAHIPDWEAKFELIVDPDYYPADLVGFVGGILKDAGKQTGVGVWSPRLKGPYGRFMVKEVRFVKKDNKDFLRQIAEEIERLQTRMASAT